MLGECAELKVLSGRRLDQRINADETGVGGVRTKVRRPRLWSASDIQDAPIEAAEVTEIQIIRTLANSQIVFGILSVRYETVSL
jgi:hypothetical protein